MNTLQQFEARQTEKHLENNNIPQFSAGDTVKINVKIREGTRERVQAFEGVCIARSGTTGPNASFTVRKVSLGEGVERVFPLFSPRIDSIEVIRHGDVRRAKLYYLRDRRGKSARITERTTGHGMETDAKVDTSGMTQTAKRAAKKAEKDAKRAEGRAANDKIVADKKAAKEAAAKEAEAAAAAEAANAEGSAE